MVAPKLENPSGLHRSASKETVQSEQDAGSANESAARAAACHRSASKETREFDEVMQVAKKHKLNVEVVRDKMKDFISHDKAGNGYLSNREFDVVVRKVCNVPNNQQTPSHLLDGQWRQVDVGKDGKVDIDKDGKVSFEEFVLWSMETAYMEEVLVPDPQERLMRKLAREFQLAITEVGKIKTSFDSFDTNKSGAIEKDEFFHAVMKLMNVKNPSDVSEKKLSRYWAEADRDRNGQISFEEFLRLMRIIQDGIDKYKLNKEIAVVAATKFTREEVKEFRRT
jgi:hypothetical protein